jgi:tetratricopeptide (TPR) repeat protein
MRVPLLCAAVLVSASAAFAQESQTPSPQKLFEAGQYQQAAQAIEAKRQPAPVSPSESYLAGQVYLRLNQTDKATQEFSRLAASQDPVWKLIGESALALVNSQLDQALDKAAQASARVAPPAEGARPQAQPNQAGSGSAGMAERFHAAYQTGLVKMKREDWAGAAEAFERAAQIDPAFAYAHYYAGLAYSRIQRPDKVALHFDHFLNVAPSAPERAGVMSIMRTIRGR